MNVIKYGMITVLCMLMSLGFINNTQATSDQMLLVTNDDLPEGCTLNSIETLSNDNLGIAPKTDMKETPFTKGVQSLSFCPEGSIISLVYTYDSAAFASDHFMSLHKYIFKDSGLKNLYKDEIDHNGYKMKVNHPESGMLYYYLQQEEQFNILLIVDAIDEDGGEKIFDTFKEKYRK